MNNIQFLPSRSLYPSGRRPQKVNKWIIIYVQVVVSAIGCVEYLLYKALWYPQGKIRKETDSKGLRNRRPSNCQSLVKKKKEELPRYGKL